VSIKKSAGALAAFTAALALLFAFAMPVLADDPPAAATPSAANPAEVTPAATPAASGAKGTISGAVTNLTAGGSSVAGSDVNLLIYTGQDQSDKQTAKAEPDGKFSFQGLETGQDYTYLLHVAFQGADYAAQPINFAQDSTAESSDVQVFDPTSDDKVISSPARHYLLEPDPDGVTVSEILIVTNSGDKTYVGSTEVQQGFKETLRFFLPDGAQNVEYGNGVADSHVFPVDGALVDTWPIYPGNSQRILRYKIPAKGDSVTFSTKVIMTTDKVNVLAPDSGASLSVTNVPNKSNPDIQGEKFLLFSGDKVTAGTEIQITMDNLSKVTAAAVGGAAPAAGAGGASPAAAATGAAPASDPQALPMIAGGVIVVLAVGGAAFMVRRRRSQPASAYGASAGAAADEGIDEPEETDDGQEARELEMEKRELVAAIAQLDDSFENKRVGPEEYGRLRSEKKSRLVEIVERQKALAASRGDL